MRIAICPGHHADAKGAVNAKFGLNEYDEAVKVVNYLGDKLTYRGHDVMILTGRLSAKVDAINAGHIDVALDIHFNADAETADTDDTKGRGCMVVHMPGNDIRKKQAARMSGIIADHMGEHDFGSFEGWYAGDRTKKDYFLEHTDCPAFIPEPLFIDNNASAEYWLVGNRHEQIAEAIAIAVIEVMDGGAA
ncbi:MAG: N-acetylmuramoyl-L-alanine amidase [Gallionella sp.]|jgi:N-acetylmuramoyl-L-alanine amidase